MIDDAKAVAAVRGQSRPWQTGFFKPPIPGWSISHVLSWRSKTPQRGEESGLTRAAAETILLAKGEPVSFVGHAYDGDDTYVSLYAFDDGAVFAVQEMLASLLDGLTLTACREYSAIVLIGVSDGDNMALCAEYRI